MRAIDADALKEKIMGVNSFANLLPAERYIINKIDSMPTIQPEQRTGKWIPQDHNKRAGNISTLVYYYPICSKCGKVGNDTYKYCPHCGAKMTKGDVE